MSVDIFKMSLLKETKELCRKYNLSPLRRRGQNFLIKEAVINKIIVASQLSKEDIVLEIGAGLGTLTKEIAEKVKKVYAVEIDKKLVEVLKAELKDYKNIEIIQGDIRKLQVTGYKLQDYKLIANLPYNITSLVIKKFLSAKIKPKLMVIMLQKEVAERITASPPRMSLLAVSVQFYGIVQPVARVQKYASWPEPKVDSVVLKISRINTNLTTDFTNKFFKFVRAGFSSKRKYLLNNLTRCAIINPVRGKFRFIGTAAPVARTSNGVNKEKLIEIFQKLGLSPKVRAQELSVEDWIRLVKLIQTIQTSSEHHE